MAQYNNAGTMVFPDEIAVDKRSQRLYRQSNNIRKVDSPILTPYPDFQTNNINLPDGLVSIFRVRIDECDRMWGLDTGVNDILGDSQVVRPMRLIVIDLKTNQV